LGIETVLANTVSFTLMLLIAASFAVLALLCFGLLACLLRVRALLALLLLLLAGYNVVCVCERC
jgi:hypothetical protein